MDCTECKLFQAAQKIKELMQRQKEKAEKMQQLAAEMKKDGGNTQANQMQYDYLSLTPINFEDSIEDLLEVLQMCERRNKKCKN